jgi:hypothetical protein
MCSVAFERSDLLGGVEFRRIAGGMGQRARRRRRARRGCRRLSGWWFPRPSASSAGSLSGVRRDAAQRAQQRRFDAQAECHAREQSFAQGVEAGELRLPVAPRPRCDRAGGAGRRPAAGNTRRARRASSSSICGGASGAQISGCGSVLRQAGGRNRPRPDGHLHQPPRAPASERISTRVAGDGVGIRSGKRALRAARSQGGFCRPALADLLRTAVDQPQRAAGGAALLQQLGNDLPEIFLVGQADAARDPRRRPVRRPRSPAGRAAGGARACARQFAQHARRGRRRCLANFEQRTLERRPQARATNERHERRGVALRGARRALRGGQRLRGWPSGSSCSAGSSRRRQAVIANSGACRRSAAGVRWGWLRAVARKDAINFG